MDLGIAGRTAVVTGASKGIGAAVVALLENEGVRVVGVSRSLNGIDVTEPDAAEKIVELTGGPIHILVNNAGTSYAKPLDELDDEDWTSQYALNVLGPMRLMRAFAPAMAKRKWGRIVNVTSSSGKRPSLTNAAYSVTKTAQLSLSRVFADAYASQGVLVNAVAPGATASGLWVGAGGLADQVAQAKGIIAQGGARRAGRAHPAGTSRQARGDRRASSRSSAPSSHRPSPAPRGPPTAGRSRGSSERLSVT